ncbi:MAG: glycosyltransferase, partial [Rhodobacteraceae bacterium]|nr:glycosyltransferase [Paracoccaceae bacterium]
MTTLCLVTFAAIATAAGWLLSGGGWTWLDIGIFASIMVSAPWTVLGFWNAVIGLWLLRCARDPFALVSPFLKDAEAEPRPVESRVAVFMTLRNEDVERAYERLIAMRQSLDDTGQGAAYDFFVLSDSSNTEVIAQEETLFAANQAQLNGQGQARYRRREKNTGFKAGNVRDFLERWGDSYEFMLPLDADSVMSGEKIVELTRNIERHPKLGILQSLAIGAPASSPFARMFQFGMRHGMRSFTMGSAWWQGDCGPFWGHN